MHRNAVLGVVALSSVIAVGNAQTSDAVSQDDPVIAYYTERYRVSAGEAQQRLARTASIMEVQRALEAKYPNQFAGLYLQHEPDFKVVVLMTGEGEGLLRSITADPLF